MFNDPELEKIVIESQKKFNENAKKYDEISSDIRALEKFLKDNHFVDKIKYGLNEVKEDCVFSAFISWDSDRLFYDGTEYKRPLIECPISIRLNCAPHLSEFLKKCIENLRG